MAASSGITLTSFIQGRYTHAVIFRNPFIYPDYLRYCFTSPYFKDLMMSNVSGVGGSLMRAQPASVAKYLFPLPPLAEQRRIVEKIEEILSAVEKLHS